MDGKVALEEHFSTELNNQFWNAKAEEDRNGKAYAQDVERRLLDPALCVAEMDRAGVETCILSLTSPGVQPVIDASGHFHTKPSLKAIEQSGADRVLFSIGYPYAQMDVAGRWFDDMPLTEPLKLKIGRENANILFKLGLAPLGRSTAAGFAS